MSAFHRNNPELFIEDHGGEPVDEDALMDLMEQRADAYRDAEREEYELRAAREEHDCDGMTEHEFNLREQEEG